MQRKPPLEPLKSTKGIYLRHQRGADVEMPPRSTELPMEIILSICKVVLEVSSSVDPLQYYPKLETLRLVCRLWDRILCGSPPLWVHLSSHQPSASWETILSRSYPLGFNAILHPGCDEHVRIVFIQHLVARMERLQSATLAFLDPIEEHDISTFISSPAPLLSSLFIHFSNANIWDFKLSNVLGGHAPALTTFSITANIADEANDVPALYNGRLKALSIDNYQSRVSHPGRVRQAITDFIPDLLLRSPRLQLLSLKWCKITRCTREPTPIQLDDMRDLTIWVCEDLLLEFIWETVKAHKCRRTKLVTWDSIPTTLEPLVAAHMIATLRNAVPEEQLRLSFLQDGSFHFNGSVAYGLHGDIIWDDLEALGRMFDLFPAEIRDRVGTVAIAASRGNEHEEFFRHFVVNVLPAFSNVIELHFGDLSRGIDIMLLVGSHPEGAQPNVQLPCPKLQRIRLSSQTEEEVPMETLKSIRNLVMARTAFTVENNVGGSDGLKSLHLPPSSNAAAISEMFKDEGVTVLFEDEGDVFRSVTQESRAFLGPENDVLRSSHV